MTSYSNNFEIQGKKIKVEDDNNKDANYHNDNHDFWNEAPEDLLIEIFVRHPDCRSAVRTSTVCRLWHSLISRNLQFIQRFKSHHHQHQDRYPPAFPWTIVFRNTDFYRHPTPKPQHFRTTCKLYSEEWLFLHGKLSANCLDFLPSPMVIKASCNDLLFVSPASRHSDDHYICNPITKQFAQLPVNPRPEVPRIYEDEAIGYALVCMPPSDHNTNIRFKVVEVLPSYDYPVSLDLNVEPNRMIPVTIFCSELRKWEIRNFPFPGPSTVWRRTYSLDIITCNETLYWLGYSATSERVVCLDLAKEKCSAINIPPSDKFSAHRIGTVRVSGGVHELRLVQVLSKHKPGIVHLRIWRFHGNGNGDDDDDDDDDDGDGSSNWFLVHDKKLKRPIILGQVLPFVGPFVHPTNGDLVFIIWGKTVIEYNLNNATCKKIGELLEIVHWYDFTPFLMVLSSRASNLANNYL